MFNKPEVNPLSTCSSSSGFTRHSQEPEQTKTSDSDICDGVLSETSPNTAETSEARVAKKRTLRTSAAEKRHKENIERKDRFLDLFEKLVDKIWRDIEWIIPFCLAGEAKSRTSVIIRQDIFQNFN